MEFLAVDTETNGLDLRHDPNAMTIGVAIADSPATGKYFPLYHELGGNLYPQEVAIDKIRRLIESADALIFHNRKFDVLALRKLGIEVQHKKAYDTMLMAHFINENLFDKSLNALSKKYGGKPKNHSELMKKFIALFGWGGVPVEVMEPYAVNDAEITYDLFTKLYPEFQAQGFDGSLWGREIRFQDLISRMEILGIGIDQDLCIKEARRGKTRMDEIRKELGLNPASPQDLEELLIHRLKLPIEKLTPKGKPSFDKEAMKAYEEILSVRDDPTARLILEYRGWQKSVSSNYDAYLHLLGRDGYLHPDFKLHGARTGRLSCEKPNLQQIPRSSTNPWNGHLKRAFIPRPGYGLWEADYANLELRLAAVYSQEPNLVNPLRAGFKPFDAMAEQLGWERQNCKTFTYATLYGGGVQRIANLFGLPWEAAKEMREDWFNNYPGLRLASDRATRLAERRGYVSLWTGRRRHLPPTEAHKAFNSLLQGGAAELVKSVMLTLSEVIDWESCRMLLQVHDSIVFEIAQGAEEYWLPKIHEIMEDTSAYHARFERVPFPVEIKRWGS